MTDASRFTIALPTEVKQTYERMAKAGGLSLSRCISEWLADTGDAALFTALKMEEARNAPTQVFNDLLSMTAGAREQILEAKQSLRARRKSEPSAASASRPPSSNTGVYRTRQGSKK